MKLTRFWLLASLSIATGCVSSGRYDDLKQREQELSWRVEVAERATLKAESEKKLAERELDLSKEDAKCLREKLALASDQINETKSQCDEELKARLAELQAKAPSKQEITPWGGVVLESGILFDTGKSELTKAGEQSLGGIVEALAGPKYEGWLVELAGHTDSDPIKSTATSYRDNHDLAAKRANSVRRFLVTHGVPATRLYLSAWGETRPLQSEATPDAKAANRRVEIRLHRDTDVSLPAGARPDASATKPASSPRADKAPGPAEAPETKPSDKPEDKPADKPADKSDDATAKTTPAPAATIPDDAQMPDGDE